MQQLQKSTYQIYGITLSSNQPLPILTPAATAATADVEVYLTRESSLSYKNETEKYPSGWYRRQKADGVYYCLSLGGREEKLDLDVEIAPDGKQIWITTG